MAVFRISVGDVVREGPGRSGVVVGTRTDRKGKIVMYRPWGKSRSVEARPGVLVRISTCESTARCGGRPEAPDVAGLWLCRACWKLIPAHR